MNHRHQEKSRSTTRSGGGLPSCRYLRNTCSRAICVGFQVPLTGTIGSSSSALASGPQSARDPARTIKIYRGKRRCSRFSGFSRLPQVAGSPPLVLASPLHYPLQWLFVAPLNNSRPSMSCVFFSSCTNRQYSNMQRSCCTPVSQIRTGIEVSTDTSDRGMVPIIRSPKNMSCYQALPRQQLQFQKVRRR